ncbi:TetR/AcrR family transcriptional regulator C-terminal ligand-binding domain-containing protein [Streptomyces sp. NBC_00335]|uniref:TetR-like C-terminal domain-containing protein n=1 Tax=unclassified Streptomyces TaxID=2593676 RepID=UPI002256F352|nr:MULTISPECIES: TetR-like C-terminal domain-containing protein [unclassified Streptomyces]MCX5405299.1 TetR/AcrR family transcriptional regulator C-terminal ligand-binding domain-containing protein [Streptomyces sp. NBC_00086]
MQSPKQPTGRPRETRVDAAIRDAVRELVPRVGYAGLTMDAIAAKAGIGKAAIYRRHSSRGELVFSVLVHGRRSPDLPDTGTLTGDLTALAGLILGIFSDPVTAAAAPGLLADVRQQPDVAARFQETFIAEERAQIAEMLERAHQRGELTAPADPALVHAAVLGTAYGWLFLLDQPPTPALASHLAALGEAAARGD